MSAPTSAELITKASKSNLALSFIALSGERRRDITTFYAFCRIVDDIADSAELTAEEKRARLEMWRTALAGPVPGEEDPAPAVRDIIAKYRIAPEHFEEIIRGVEMDVEPAGYETFEELRLYCHRVASAVGLVSIEIFGYRNPACRRYAIDLGLALQITHILRDVGEDLAIGRIYLPREDMKRFGYSGEDLAAHRHDERFLALMEFQAARAFDFYEKAAAELPCEDRRSMIAAEIMRRIYRKLLTRMKRDQFRVFDRRYALSAWQKASAVLRSLV